MDRLFKVLGHPSDTLSSNQGSLAGSSALTVTDTHDGRPSPKTRLAGCHTLVQHNEPFSKPKDASSARAVRFLWCDTAGIRRCRVIPGHRYASCQSSGVGITCACMAMPAYADSPASGSRLSAVGEARMKPVEHTRVDLPWCPGHQMVLVSFEEPKSDAPWAYCPRTALLKTCKMMKDNFGLEVKAGFEIEFLLLERVPPGGGRGLHDTPWRPVDSALYCQSSALDRQSKVLDAMIDALEALGIGVVQWHPESAHGQYEIALSYVDALEAADKLLLAREAIVAVANCHDLAVSFLPKPFPNAAGSGCHVHLSLWKDGLMAMHTPASADNSSMSPAAACILAAASRRSPGHSHPLPTHASDSPAAAVTATVTAAVPADVPRLRLVPRPSPEMQCFLAGLVTYLDVLLPFTTPSANSFDRLRPGTWAGAHVAWGFNNREVPIRVTAPGPDRLDCLHIEVKCVDNTANPYIALSAILVAGMLGLFAKAPLSEPCQVPPAALDASAAARLGLRLLPSSLHEALAGLQKNGQGGNFQVAMSEAIGAPLLDTYIAVRQAEALHAGTDRPCDQLLRYS